MVKGLSRRVVVVRSPDSSIFEEAIFIIKEDAADRGVTSDAILREAQAAANDYLRKNTGPKILRHIPAPAFAAAGAALTAIIWAATYLFL